MTFVTRLTLQSGDRAVLDDVVADIKATARRKGAELKGPHPRPPKELRIPQYKSVDGDAAFDPWSYTVYTRELEIVGHDEFARNVAGQDFPCGIHVSVEVERVRGVGSS
ncbi:30S ribosomal protein S10 [Halobacteriales archaeon QS_1_68_20]|nr:MAG: 30S ribosomal protein S10 [Halobacteriales archaeon QS_1_68_20]